MKLALFVVTLVLSTLAIADCPQLYPHNTPIKIAGAIELCNDHYVSLYDAQNRAVLLTSEVIQPAGHDVKRKNTYRRDGRVKTSPTPGEYEHSGYDKGHMVPADDATTTEQMVQSFLMTNMTPQDPTLNRGRWRGLELRIRNHVVLHNTPTHVVTVATYANRPPMIGSIPIPSGYGKIAYFQTGTVAYYTTNTKYGSVSSVSVDWINKLTPFAKLPQ